MRTFGIPATSSPVKMLLIVNVVLYLFTLLPVTGPLFLRFGALVPADTFAGGQLWRLLTYMFLHDPSSSFHLIFNMLALWMFSHEIEEIWGSRRFTLFYLSSGIGAGCFSIIHLFVPGMAHVSVIGASGAVLALLTVYAWYFPQRDILLFFILPVNIRIVVIGYALISLFGTLAPRGVVSHLTHLGGIVVAFAYMQWYPLLTRLIGQASDRRKERVVRSRIEAKIKKDRFFEESIDPILDKISREGMDSLTPGERQLLKKVAQSKDRSILTKRNIIPFDSFR